MTTLPFDARSSAPALAKLPPSLGQSGGPRPAEDTIGLHLPAQVCELIDRAAAAAEKSREAFLMDAILDASEATLLHRATFGLDEAQLSACQALLDRPLDENPGFQRLMARKAPWAT